MLEATSNDKTPLVAERFSPDIGLRRVGIDQFILFGLIYDFFALFIKNSVEFN